MYFSDIYNDKHVSEEVKKNEVLWGEGISGALQWEEFLKLAHDVGFSPPMLVTVSPLMVEDPELRKIVGVCVCVYKLHTCVTYVFVWKCTVCMHTMCVCTTVYAVQYA